MSSAPFREAASNAATPSAAQALAVQLLRGATVRLGTSIDPAQWRKAIAAFGAGPDHHVGDTSVALVVGDLSPGGNCNGAVVTDRRFIARSGDTLVDFAYADLADVQGARGVVFDDLFLHGGGRSAKLEGIQEMPMLLAFLQAMVRTHPVYRAPAPRPVPAPSPHDPTGAAEARAALVSGDPRPRILVELADQAFRQQKLPQERAADLVARAALLDRTLAYGRGTSGGWWTSALPAVDLADAFARMLGPPYQAFDTHQGRVFEHRLEGGGANPGAALSTAVGLLALGILGVGWVSTPGRSLRDVRVQIQPGAFSSGFALFEEGKALSVRWPQVVEAAFETLSDIEARRLLQRTVWGWEATPAQLAGAPVEEFVARVQAVLGAVDLGVFFATRARP